ncbi:hypothetical protein HK099_007760 [Clydaea vesicula]|uniref:Aldose 1-epimerase n=1 Tax=Clydaea vesicula TaxID=447962 RepID=A0AAD5XXB5_9FUNG|nr:hypothetical protein HK099_007760 [Clydaea vesicula]
MNLILKSEHAEARFSNFGASLTHLIFNSKVDVVMGLDDPDAYETNSPYFGVIGRTCNRTENGRFELNGKTYQLAINNGPNNLHGGIKGIDKYFWDSKFLDLNTLQFEHISDDMNEGYPGKLLIRVSYKLVESISKEGKVTVTLYQSFLAKLIDLEDPTLKTVVNLTNHTYWNLNGFVKEALEHEFEIPNENGRTETNKDQCPNGNIIKDLPDSPFSFLKKKSLGKDYDKVQEYRGYDHYYLIKEDNSTNKDLVLGCKVYSPQSKIGMELWTDALVSFTTINNFKI